MAKIVIFQSLPHKFKGKRDIFPKEFYWHFLSNNGQIMCVSEGYRTRWGAKRGATRFQIQAAYAEIEVENA